MSEISTDAENRLKLSPRASTDDRFQVIFDAVSDGIFISSPETGKFIEVNQPGCRLFGYDKAELIGGDIGTISSGIPPYTLDMAIENGARARRGENPIFEWQCRNKDDVLFWAEVSLRFAEFDHADAIIAVVRDITERKQLNSQIVHMAQHDALTGLANRYTFASAVDRAIAQSNRTGNEFAILFIDLDRFKDVNDTRGHPIGDRLLQLVAERLQAGVRANETLARFGGDEFAILLGDPSEPAQIAALASRLIASLGRPYSLDGIESHVGASIGVAIYGKDASDAEMLMSHADIALYRAKDEGRRTYRFYSDEMDTETRSRVMLTDELRAAIPGGQLFLVYQPQVTAEGSRIVGVEALVRWRHPRRGTLAPAQFLEVAESSGLIVPLGKWVLREACRQGREWLDRGVPPGSISVNLSSAQLKDPFELEKIVSAVLAETRLPPHLLELEIAESTLTGLSSRHGDMIQRLRGAGVRFALADFGTGNSSLNFLRRVPVDRIKIEEEFVSELASSGKAPAIVKLILGLARELGSDVIAEGVETCEQHTLLRNWDCPKMQGFYFAEPMCPEAVAELLSGGTIDRSEPAAAFAT